MKALTYLEVTKDMQSFYALTLHDSIIILISKIIPFCFNEVLSHYELMIEKDFTPKQPLTFSVIVDMNLKYTLIYFLVLFFIHIQ